MKRNKLIAFLLVMLMTVSLLGCNPATPGTESKDSSTSEASGTTDETNMTDGVWFMAADATHEALIKFKEDGTFYARGLMGSKGVFGLYEVVEMEIEYYDAGANGTIDSDDGYPLTPQKATKAVKFMNPDGTALAVRRYPATVKDENEADQPITPLNEGIGTEYCALTDDIIHQFSVDDYIRSVKHDPARVFTEDDEIRNLLYKFMVKEVPEAAAADGWEQDDLTLELYHNGYVDMATSDTMIAESYKSIDGNVYTLEDDAVVTVDPDAYTAVYKKGDVTMEFVKFIEGGLKEVKTKFSGEAFSGAIVINAFLYVDNTIMIIADKSGTETVLASGTYEGSGIPVITLDKGTATVTATSAEDVTLTWTGDIGNGSEADYILAKVDIDE